MEKPRRVSGRYCAGISDQSATAPNADRRPAAAYLRPDLRFSAALKRGCRLSRDENRRGGESGHAAVDDRRSGETSAGVLARRGMELFCFDRCHWLSNWQDHRQAVRAITEGAYP